MLDINSQKFGRVIICEPVDLNWQNADEVIDIESFDGLPHTFKRDASVIAYRNLSTGVVQLLKNRYGPRDDAEVLEFIKRFREQKEKDDPIVSRLDILDL